MKTLKQIYDNNKHKKIGVGDKGTYHSYIPYYEKALAPYRKTAKQVLEIGIKWGHSLNMWDQYFNDAQIIGVDINKFRELKVNDGIQTVWGDATKPETFKNIDNLDVVIDDGSHLLEHQIESFKLLWPKLKSGGIYIIEDIADLDANKTKFQDLHESCKVFDYRNILNRYDDVIIQYKKD